MCEAQTVFGEAPCPQFCCAKCIYVGKMFALNFCIVTMLSKGGIGMVIQRVVIFSWSWPQALLAAAMVFSTLPESDSLERSRYHGDSQQLAEHQPTKRIDWNLLL